MTPQAHRVVQRFLRKHVRVAFADEFLQWADNRRFPNPNPKGRLKEIKFKSLPNWEQQRIYTQWMKHQHSQKEGPSNETPAQQKERLVDLAKTGKVTSSERLSTGMNSSYVVRIEKDGLAQTFIRKPAEGEDHGLRTGIPEYHSREQAAYTIDSLIGGESVVPVTQTRGPEDGSYQMWADGSKPLQGASLQDVVRKVPLDELVKNKSFERVNTLDLILGHQDRHSGNLLYTFDNKEETPENLRFIAIDNGLSLAEPVDDEEEDDDFAMVYENPFTSWFPEKGNERSADYKKHEINAHNAVAQSVSTISKELHDSLRKVNLKDVAQAMTSAGIDNEGAIRAALSRLLAFQKDPSIFKKYLDKNKGDMSRAWINFQNDSNTQDALLTEANAMSSRKEIDRAVAQAKQPQGKTAQQPNAQRIAARWLIAKPRPRRTLVISFIHMPTRKLEPLGKFTLEGDTVHTTYYDSQFKNEIQRGIRLPGKTLRPQDGAAFLDALQKVYGARTLYDVHNS